MIPYPIQAAGWFLLGWIIGTVMFLPIALRLFDRWVR